MVEPREAKPTVKFIDEYCEWYKKLFPEVRSFEAFKYLHFGMISDIKRKTLPALARLAGLSKGCDKQSNPYKQSNPKQSLA